MVLEASKVHNSLEVNKQKQADATDLEEVNVPVGVAQAEDVLFLGVFGDGLHDAVLCEQGVARGEVLLTGGLPISLIEEQHAA